MISISDLGYSLARLIYGARHYVYLAGIGYVVYWLIARILFTISLRRQYLDFPQLPRHWLWGNLVNCGARLSPNLNRHPDYGFEEIWKDLDYPSCFVMDLSPVDKAFIVVADPTVCEALVNPSPQYRFSTPKSDTYYYLTRLVGQESLLSRDGEEWRSLRKRFNPGFAPRYLHSLAPSVVAETQQFVDRLLRLADSGEVFTLAGYAQDLTTDIITQITVEQDLHAQSTPEGQGEKSLFGILRASRRGSELVFKTGQGFNPLGYVDPIRPLKAWFYEKVIDRKLSAIVASKMQLHKSPGESATPSTSGPAPPLPLESTKSIAGLATAGLAPTAALVRNTVHQVKTFLFAGQDTTATLVQWMCYELSKAAHSTHHAAIVAKLRAEHDAVYGSSSLFSAAAVLASGGAEADHILGSQLPYTTAFVKETLRLHPPAATARLLRDDVPFALTFPTYTASSSPSGAAASKTADAAGLRVYLCQYLIHRNAHVWGADVLAFRPERWLDDAYVAGLPAGAWRPFERGPRNCIGQELAMLEAKVVLSMVARGLEFEKIGLTGRRPTNETTKLGAPPDIEPEVWSTHNVTSVPVDGMRMKVTRRLKEN